MLGIIFFNSIDVLNLIICTFLGTIDAPFQHQLIESSSTETAPHTITAQWHSHVFLINAAKVGIKDKIMLFFFLQIPYDYAGRGSSVGSVSAWHANNPEFDPHIQHILWIWSWNNFYGHFPSSADSRRAAVSNWWKNVHLILVNCPGDLPRNSVVNLIG